ncbi:MAG: hypothetical protein HZB38_09490 [Planctomycetes bacterium]|nr:hypothetical protein [Planctomycetota bacterium]
MNRWIGIACLAFMLSVNTALFLRDVLPRWTAGHAPPPPASTLRPNQDRRTQLAIYNSDGNLVGRSWTIASRSAELLTVRTLTRLDSLPIPIRGGPKSIAVGSEFFYDNNLRLTDIVINVFGLGVPLSLRGAFVEPDTFPCQWQLDEHRGEFILEGAATRSLIDFTRPFDELEGLQVGQSWRVEVFNPLGNLLPGMQDEALRTEALYFKVTRKESLDHRGRKVECNLVEGERIKAWIDSEGRAIRQTIEMPLVGELTLVDEPFIAELHREAQVNLHSESETRK